MYFENPLYDLFYIYNQFLKKTIRKYFSEDGYLQLINLVNSYKSCKSCESCKIKINTKDQIKICQNC